MCNECNDNFLITKELAWRWSSVDLYKTKLFRRGSTGDGIGQGQIHKVEAFRRMYRCGVKINNLHTRLKFFIDHFDLSETRSQHMWTTTRKPSWGDLASLPHLIIIGHLSLYIIWYIIYDSFSDVGESRVWFASKILTPCRMHWNAFLIAQIIAKCHSFPNMYGML